MDIEDNIPAPDHAKRMRYPFADMGVGQSAVFLSRREDTSGCNAVSAAHAYGQRNGKRFASSYIGDYQVRIWRVE